MIKNDFCYIWKDGQVETISSGDYLIREHLDMYMVDGDHDFMGDRYGMWTTGISNNVIWRSILLANFPPEFRAALLLLGVT